MLSWEEKRQDRILAQLTHASTIDFGVVLNVVVADPNGIEYVKNKPKLRILRSHRRGGIVTIDRDGVRFTGVSARPQQWYCSEEAEPLILHDDSLADNLLVYGSEGAGKTTAQAMWCFFRVLERVRQGYRGEIGMTAPTMERANFIREAIEKTWKPEWYRWKERDYSFHLPVGIDIKLKSTKRQSAASGSPIQGYNWSDSGNDEIQDSLDADSDIESRLRDAPGGRGKRFATATAKDHPEFRAWRDKQIAAEVAGKRVWEKRQMLAENSPFIEPGFIARKKATMTEREFNRRYKAMDLGPEDQVYYSWTRDQNLRPIPANAIDVTSRELSGQGRNVVLLCGHDPGRRIDVTLFIKAYELPDARFPDGRKDNRPRWWVIDEITGRPDESHEAHVKIIKSKLENLGCNLRDRNNRLVEGGARALVRADPHTRSGDEHPGQDLYAIWLNHGIDIRPAAYAPNSTKPLQIKPESRIELINTLLCDANQNRRLFVLCDDNRQPRAPKLVDSFETMERDLTGRAEHERKDERDKSHWPAALAYALWSAEKPRVTIGLVA